MKRIFITFALLGLVFSTNLWAHHAAEGIISDEVWDQVDENISDQHNEMLDVLGTTMEVVTDPATSASPMSTMESQENGGNNVFLMTARTYEFTESVPESEYVTTIEEVIDQYVVPEAELLGRFPSLDIVDAKGDIDSRLLYVTYELVDLDEPKDGSIDGAIIYTYEPIGKGSEGSQVPPDDSDEPPQGKRAGG